MTITLLILALAVAFVLWRLSSVIGQDQGFIPQIDRSNAPNPDAANAVETPQEPEPFFLEEEAIHPEADASALRAVLEQIAERDRLFSAMGFLDDAGNAFEMILGAFAKGDKDTLSSFVSKDVYAGFKGAIDARAEAGQSLELTLIKAPEALYHAAEINGNMAFVTLAIRSEQIQVTRSSEGEIVSGDPTQTTTVVDHWNFSRKLGSSDPIWTLIATQA